MGECGFVVMQSSLEKGYINYIMAIVIFFGCIHSD